jgi:NtrC-family two-component system sensor histidine kinase KinB
LEAALTGCEELGGTIDELLDVTRIEAGKLRLDLAPVDLEPILNQVLRNLRPRFEDAGVSLHIEKEGVSTQVRGDAGRLGTVLSNLLTNALKYSPAGRVVTVRFSSAPEEEPGRPMLRLAVEDQGPGIPASLRERVFEKFFRVEHQLGNDSNGVRGTGIGLYLCREIVKAHSGLIRIEAGAGGVGTRVVLLLPRH